MFAGKLKQSINQAGTSSHGTVDSAGHIVQAGFIFIVHLNKLTVDQNLSQRVSEIMGHAGGNRADRLHFLDMLQLHLQSLALGYVRDHNDDRGRFSFYRQGFNGNLPAV